MKGTHPMQEAIDALRADNKRHYAYVVLDALICILWTTLAFNTDSVSQMIFFGSMAVFMLFGAWYSLHTIEQNLDEIRSTIERDARLRNIGQ